MKRSFDNLASNYARFEALTFGRSLQQARQHAVTAFNASVPQKALLLGDGDGRFSGLALQSNPLLHIDSIDNSASMLQCAKARIETSDPISSKRFNPIKADALDYEYPLSQYDIVVSQFFLDCFPSNQANHLINQLETTLKPNGRFAYADFSIPKNSTWTPLGRLLIATLYRCFRIATDIRANRLPDLQWPEKLSLENESKLLKGILLCQIRIKKQREP